MRELIHDNYINIIIVRKEEIYLDSSE